MKLRKPSRPAFKRYTPAPVTRLPTVSWVLVTVLLVIAAIGLTRLPDSHWIELNYSRKLYPLIANVLVPLNNSVPWSLAGLAMISLLSISVAGLCRAFFVSNTPLALLRWLRATLLGSGVLYALFVFIWGANYQRQPAEILFNLPPLTQNSTQTLITDLSHVIQTTANAERNETRAIYAIRSAMQQLVQSQTTVTPALPNQVKHLPAGSLLCAGNASGIVSPWTLEPHIDAALPITTRVSTAAHELAHVAGFAAEADADFVGMLAGLSATDTFARYATALTVWRDAIMVLPLAQQQQALDDLPQVAKDDLNALRDTYVRYQVPAVIRRVQYYGYDRYLKTQGVSAGIADYSRSLQLLARAYQQGLFSLTP